MKDKSVIVKDTSKEKETRPALLFKYLNITGENINEVLDQNESLLFIEKTNPNYSQVLPTPTAQDAVLDTTKFLASSNRFVSDQISGDVKKEFAKCINIEIASNLVNRLNLIIIQNVLSIYNNGLGAVIKPFLKDKFVEFHEEKSNAIFPMLRRCYAIGNDFLKPLITKGPDAYLIALSEIIFSITRQIAVDYNDSIIELLYQDALDIPNMANYYLLDESDKDSVCDEASIFGAINSILNEQSKRDMEKINEIVEVNVMHTGMKINELYIPGCIEEEEKDLNNFICNEPF